MNLKEDEYLREQQKLKKTKEYIEREVKESENRLERGFDDYDFDDYNEHFGAAAVFDFSIVAVDYDIIPFGDECFQYAVDFG